MYSGCFLLRRLESERKQTSGGVLEVRQGEVDGGFPGSRADLCPLSHRYTTAVIRLTATHMHTPNQEVKGTVWYRERYSDQTTFWHALNVCRLTFRFLYQSPFGLKNNKWCLQSCSLTCLSWSWVISLKPVTAWNVKRQPNKFCLYCVCPTKEIYSLN